MRNGGVILVSLSLLALYAANAQQAPNYTYGNRPIDLLPKSETARAEEERGWGDPEPPREFEVALHMKDLYRVGVGGLQRLCVIEARRPEGDVGGLTLALAAGEESLWHASGDWIGTNQRMRAYWLPVRADLRKTLMLATEHRAPQQVKVWASPYLDKPDLFNSYPHWPVTRGMRTAWLSDPADFARPTHSNLANLVNAPIRETEEEKDFLWLVGMARKDEDAVAASSSWLKPGRITPGLGAVAGEYSQLERAYVVTAQTQATQCSFTLSPVDGRTITNPAFVIKGLTGPGAVIVPGTEQVKCGQEHGQLVIWMPGRFDRSLKMTVVAGTVTVGF